MKELVVMQDHMLEFPDLYLDVFVTNHDGGPRAFAEMLARSKCTKTDDPMSADLVIFTGGEDVDPRLYGEEPHRTSSYNTVRDDEDIALFLMCQEAGIPMLGVCRGAQFLHVMNGGKLYQHVDGHVGDHQMYAVKDKMRLEKVSSVHHQMVMANQSNGMETLGISHRAKERWKNPSDSDNGNLADIEAFFYRDTCCIGVQGHPEYRGYSAFQKWVLDQLLHYVVENPDTYWEKLAPNVSGNRRLKPEFMKERDAKQRRVPVIIDQRQTA